MSYTFAKEITSKEADQRLQELKVTVEARAVLQRMAYAVNQGAFMRSKDEYTTTHPLGTARLMKETFLSEYRVNKAKTELRSKNLASWTVNRVPVAGKKKIGKNGEMSEVYEANEYTINRTGLGVTWEPNKWGEQEEDSEPAGAQEIAQPSPSDSSAIAVPVSEDDNAGKILALCLSYCQRKDVPAQQQRKLRAKINTYLEGGLTADLILSAIPECMEREHWIKKIDNAKSSQIGLMISCIQDMANEAGRRRFLHNKKAPERAGVVTDGSGTIRLVRQWQTQDDIWHVEIINGRMKKIVVDVRPNHKGVVLNEEQAAHAALSWAQDSYSELWDEDEDEPYQEAGD